MTISGLERKTPRVLQVLPALNSGGVERGTVDIARAIANAHGSGASHVASAGGRMEQQLADVGGTHHFVPLDSKNPLAIRRNIQYLSDIIMDNDINVIHARSRAPAWSAYYAAKRTGAHFVTTYHGLYGTRTKLPFKKLYNSVMTRGERVIAVSKFIAETIMKQYRMDESRIRIIPRGVDLAYFDPAAVSDERIRNLRLQWGLTEDWPVILLPGRITRWKGQELLLRALARLQNVGNYYCIMAGDVTGSMKYFNELQHEIARSQLERYVRIVKATSDMPAAYMLADVVVSASIEPEAFGRVAVEAQAMGKPIIATAIGGSRETVIHGDTGRLVGRLYSAEMADGIQRGLLLHEWERENTAEKARKHIEDHFSLEQMCMKTLAVYDEVLANE